MVRRWTAMNGRVRLALIAMVLVVALPVAWYLGSPIFITRTVNEPFPAISLPMSAPESNEAANIDGATNNEAVVEDEAVAAESMDSTTLSESQPEASMEMSAENLNAPDAEAKGGMEAEVAVSPAEPVALGVGQFGQIDTVHQGAGQATIYELPDGQRVLRFEEGFQVTNGPDLYVYLSSHPAPRDSSQLHEGGAFEVAVLKGNVGSQNYELPDDLDLSQFQSVVIYCKQFSVIFSTAELGEGT